MRRIDGAGVAAEVRENPVNDRRRLDAGDDPQPTARQAPISMKDADLWSLIAGGDD